MYDVIFNIIANDIGLYSGLFGYYICTLFATLACTSILLMPFIVVFYIIKRCIT
jgi:hypothetical protein